MKKKNSNVYDFTNIIKTVDLYAGFQKQAGKVWVTEEVGDSVFQKCQHYAN